MQPGSAIYPHDFSYVMDAGSLAEIPLPPDFAEQRCANPECFAHCAHTGSTRFAGQPRCSPECLEAALRATLARENSLSTEAALETGPRVRIGQILVEQGVITEPQLERALRSQRLTGAGRLGTWLRQQTQLPEEDFAAALSIQWGCPVFRVGAFAAGRMSMYLPRPLVEALGALPLRVSREPRRLTICFEDRIEPELLRACERMHDLPVEAGLLSSNEFWYGTGELLKAEFPPYSLVEAKNMDEMILAMTEVMVRTAVTDARLVCVRGYYWLRMLVDGPDDANPVRDILCTLRASAERVQEGHLADEMLDGLERKRTQVS
jgi:hypothetical protein